MRFANHTKVEEEVFYGRKKLITHPLGLFCSSVGEWIEPRRVQTELHKVLQANGFEPFGPPALRHTYATRMLERQVPVRVVSGILGHADVKTTMQIYSHVFDTTAHDQAQ